MSAGEVEMGMGREPLKGIVVLDLTQYVSGPFCTMLLAELGANVIKIEPPGSGDVYRKQGPSFIRGVSTSYLSVNCSKQSLTLNLKREEAKEIAHRLAQRVDVVVENFRPGTADRLGIGYETLKEINPRLVYCSISGYGQDGPDATSGGYDLMAQARGGIMAITGSDPESPTKVGVPVVDLCSAVYGALGIVTALWARERKAHGSHVDISLLDTAVSFLPMALAEYQGSGVLPGPLGTASPFFAPYEAFLTKDGFITLIGTGGKDHWERLCGVLGRDDLIADPRFATNSDRVARRAELHAIIEAILATDPCEHWLERFRAAGVPCDPIQNLDGIINDRQVRSRKMIVSYDHPVAGRILTTTMPVIFDGRKSIPEPAPELGQHTDEILAWLGYSHEEIVSFRRAGVTDVHAGTKA